MTGVLNITPLTRVTPFLLKTLHFDQQWGLYVRMKRTLILWQAGDFIPQFHQPTQYTSAQNTTKLVPFFTRLTRATACSLTHCNGSRITRDPYGSTLIFNSYIGLLLIIIILYGHKLFFYLYLLCLGSRIITKFVTLFIFFIFFCLFMPVTQKTWPDLNCEFCDPLHP